MLTLSTRCAIAVLFVFVQAVGADDLSRILREAIDIGDVGKTAIGISVIDADTGLRIVEGLGDDRLLIPASNMKLLTSGAALLTLGPEFAFRTELRVWGTTLIVVGDGDPALADPALLERMTPPMPVSRFLDALAEAARAAGPITEVVIDDRVFDQELVHPTWPVNQLNNAYCAQVSGLNFHHNVLDVFATPSSTVGGAPVVRTEPEAPWMEFEVRAVTTGGRDASVWLTRVPETNRFTMYGKLGVALSSPVQVTVHDPAQVFGRLLSLRLEGNPPVRRASGGETFEGARTIAVLTSSMEDVLKRCNTESRNLYAESLIKRIGHEVTGEAGSWSNGAAAVRAQVTRIVGYGYATSMRIADGSGMSRENRVTPALLTAWIAGLRRDPYVGEAFLKSLASAGEGTIRDRFPAGSLECEIRAKTGYLSGVRAISGVLSSEASGRAVAFSILMNETNVKDAQARKLQQTLVQLIDEWVARQSFAGVPEPR